MSVTPSQFPPMSEFPPQSCSPRYKSLIAAITSKKKKPSIYTLPFANAINFTKINSFTRIGIFVLQRHVAEY
ncbi:unnamed protein product, partial [Staurois parvus]